MNTQYEGHKPTYGTTEYYADMFSDILADVDGESKDYPNQSDRIVNGFLYALEDWFNYHDVQARTYSDLRLRVRKTLGL